MQDRLGFDVQVRVEVLRSGRREVWAKVPRASRAARAAVLETAKAQFKVPPP